ncbi:MAG: HNH endonuclease, partial [Mycobacterium sp.]|nr:HNH endonuclease [Mycobacterium sp.]MCX6489250.1 HNH endonuclease [Mycobacterium sp.]
PIDDLPPGRTLMMPTRKRTRAAERAARIAWERGLNEARWAADPPPF